MKSEFVINRDELLKAVEIISLVPFRPSIRSSEFIMIEECVKGIKMYLTSEISGYVHVKGKGKWGFDKPIFIDRRLFSPFITAAKNIKSKADFEFRRINNDLLIKNGNRKVKMTLSKPSKGYAEASATSGKEVKVESELIKMLGCAKYCATTEPSLPMLNCVYAIQHDSKLNLLATNEQFFFKGHFNSSLKLKESIPFPLFITELFNNSDIKGIQTTSQEIILDFGIGKIWQTVSVSAKKKFPRKEVLKIMKMYSEKSKLAFEIDSKHFVLIVNRLAGYMASVRRQDWVLKMVGKKGSTELGLESTIAMTTFREKLVMEKPVHYDFEVDWPLDQTLDVINNMARKDQKMAVSFDKENRTYVKTGGIEILIPRRAK